jgi:hypothetical protein
MNRSLKNLIITLTVVCVVIAAAIGWLVWQINAQSNKVTALEQELLEKEQDAREEVGLRTLVEDTSGSIEYLADRLVDKDQAVDFIEALEHVGTAAGVQMSVDSVERGDQSISAIASTEGSWNQVNHALALLETMPLAVTIQEVGFDAIDVSPTSRPKSRVEWKARFNVSVLTLPVVTDATTTPETADPNATQ